MKEPKLVLNAAKCRNCLTVIVSTSVHDFRSCLCGNIFVDGGRDYTRAGGKDLSDIVPLYIVEHPTTGRFVLSEDFKAFCKKLKEKKVREEIEEEDITTTN